MYIYIYPPASFHLSIFPTPKHQGTKTLVPLEPNVLFADLKDSFRRNENPEGNREAMRLMGLFFGKNNRFAKFLFISHIDEIGGRVL